MQWRTRLFFANEKKNSVYRFALRRWNSRNQCLNKLYNAKRCASIVAMKKNNQPVDAFYRLQTNDEHNKNCNKWLNTRTIARIVFSLNQFIWGICIYRFGIQWHLIALPWMVFPKNDSVEKFVKKNILKKWNSFWRILEKKVKKKQVFQLSL